ncbi:MAG: hypothetical protein ACRD17_13275 [Terriglobales bacterium]
MTAGRAGRALDYLDRLLMYRTFQPEFRARAVREIAELRKCLAADNLAAGERASALVEARLNALARGFLGGPF